MDSLQITKECKPWYKSKTVWFNIIAILGTAVDGLVGMLYLVEPFVAPGVYPFVMLVVGLINIILRAISEKAVRFTEAGAQEYGGDWRNGRDDVFVD